MTVLITRFSRIIGNRKTFPHHFLLLLPPLSPDRERERLRLRDLERVLLRLRGDRDLRRRRPREDERERDRDLERRLSRRCEGDLDRDREVADDDDLRLFFGVLERLFDLRELRR